VYEFLYQRLVPSEPVVVEFEGSKVCVDPRDIGVSLYLITEGTYEPRLTQLLSELIKPGMVVVDGGANVGCFTMLAAKLVGGVGRVYAFEPAPESFELLERGIELNGYSNVVATRCALSSYSGSETLYLDRSNFGASSLRGANVADREGQVEVPVTSLDDFFAGSGVAVDLIKLDTQGAEGLVLEGAQSLLAQPQLTIVSEFWPAGLRSLGTDPAEFLRQLRDRGFKLAWLDERTGEVGPAADADVIAECDARKHEQGFATLVLQGLR